MKKYRFIAFILLGFFLFQFAAIQAADSREGERRIVWSKKPTGKNGLYTAKNYFVSHGISLNGSAMYYSTRITSVTVDVSPSHT